MLAPGYKGKGGRDNYSYDVGATPPATKPPLLSPVKPAGAPVTPPPGTNPGAAPNNDMFAALLRKLSPETTVALNNMNMGAAGGMGQNRMLPPQSKLPPQYRYQFSGKLFGGSLFGR